MPATVQRLIRFLERRHAFIVLLLSLSAVLAGGAYSFVLGNRLRYPDERVYYALARNLAESHAYTVDGVNATAKKPPGYPWLLASLIYLGADVPVLRMANFFALGLSIVLVYAILTRHVSHLAGVVGALFVGLYGVLFYTAGTLYPQTFGGFLFLLVLYMVPETEHRSIAFSAAVGLILGYLVLSIPTFIVSLAVIVAWLLYRRPALVRVLVLVGVSGVVILSWSARNYSVFGSFGVSTDLGMNLLVGNSENTTPNAGPTVDLSAYVRSEELAGMNEAESDRYYRSQAVQFMREHKSRAAKLYLLKFLNWFNFRNQLATASESSSGKDLVMVLTYGPLVLLFMLRLLALKWCPPSRVEWLFIMLYFSGALFCSIFFTRIRYRLPFDFLMIMVSAAFVCHVVGVLRQRRPALFGT